VREPEHSLSRKRDTTPAAGARPLDAGFGSVIHTRYLDNDVFRCLALAPLAPGRGRRATRDIHPRPSPAVLR
jgi:hypothetical protein